MMINDLLMMRNCRVVDGEYRISNFELRMLNV